MDRRTFFRRSFGAIAVAAGVTELASCSDETLNFDLGNNPFDGAVVTVIGGQDAAKINLSQGSKLSSIKKAIDASTRKWSATIKNGTLKVDAGKDVEIDGDEWSKRYSFSDETPGGLDGTASQETFSKEADASETVFISSRPANGRATSASINWSKGNAPQIAYAYFSADPNRELFLIKNNGEVVKAQDSDASNYDLNFEDSKGETSVNARFDLVFPDDASGYQGAIVAGGGEIMVLEFPQFKGL